MVFLDSSKKNTDLSLNIYSLFSPNAKNAWQDAIAHTKKRKEQIGVESIFLSLLKKPSVTKLMARLKVDPSSAEIFLKNYLRLQPTSGSETIKKLPFEAFSLAVKLSNPKIGSLMLLGALLKIIPQDNILQAIFTNIGLTLENLEIYMAWVLNLKYEFPKNSNAQKLLYCCRQSQGLEEHFGYFFELPAIETAVKFSSKITLKDLEHKKALQLLVKAAGLAKSKGLKSISQSLVIQAMEK